MKALWVLGAASGIALSFSAMAFDGETIVEKHCKACHKIGLAGAPKLGDKEAWAPHLATGVEAMAATVLKGKGAMPPKGTCGTCTPEQILAAVEALIADVK
ncbi:c-type cytochrome [Neptunomonas sp.]|uniref:c-type cytochrome n=1 Tax=Neptunomonas sp. TaxID=1971898 RepID=UPI0025E06FE3|nr:c-type cytochrome [Neptunomonas sp.]